MNNTVLVREASLDWSQFIQILLLYQYNTRVVVIGVTILGFAAGIIGTFLLLRKRSLFSDAISHATLPGIGIAYLVMVALSGSGKNLAGLLFGALVFGLIGMGCVLLIRAYTAIKEDTAIGVVLSVFFGSGVALLGIIQKMSTGNAAGLQSYIYGKTASMIAQDAIIISIAAAVIFVLTVLLLKELNIATFDPTFAASEGYPVVFLDVTIVGLTVLLTVIGLQAVGLILVTALLIIPAAAARFWTNRLSVMLVLSAFFGALSGYAGAAISAAIPNLPAGAIIVLAAGTFFVFSMIFGYQKGLLTNGYRMFRFTWSLTENRTLITLFRLTVKAAGQQIYPVPAVKKHTLKDQNPARFFLFDTILGSLMSRKLIDKTENNRLRLTPSGLNEAQRCLRNHELQHMYLRAFPEQAQGLHQRDEEHIEDFIGENVLTILQNELRNSRPELYAEFGVPDEHKGVLA
jgi:manganese/zinc/iron transport system permease protein